MPRRRADCRPHEGPRRCDSTTGPSVADVDEVAGGGPGGELAAVGELQLAQDGGDVGLDRLHREHEVARDLAVGVAARDEPHHLALARAQLVEALGARGVLLPRGERVEHEPREAGREDGVAVGHAADRIDQVVGGDVLGDVPARTAAHDADHVVGGVGHRQREELHARAGRSAHASSTARPPPPGRWTSSSTTSGRVAHDHRDRLVGVAGLAHHLDPIAELGAHARRGTSGGRRRARRAGAMPRVSLTGLVRGSGSEGADADAAEVSSQVAAQVRRPRRRPATGASREAAIPETPTSSRRRPRSTRRLRTPSGTGSVSATSAPSPAPSGPRPCRRPRTMRAITDSRSPSRSPGTASGSKPGPRSRTNTSTPSRPHSTYTDTWPPACLAALTTASRAAATSASTRSSRGTSPTCTTSTAQANVPSTAADLGLERADERGRRGRRSARRASAAALAPRCGRAAPPRPGRAPSAG